MSKYTVIDKSGHILKRVSCDVTKLQAENILKNIYYSLWVRGEALPVIATNPKIHY
jgi:hypothetical protein